MAMIRINLAPIEEMENPYWWVLDAAVFVVAFAIALAIVNTHFDNIKEQTANRRQNAQAARDEATSLKPKVDRVKELERRRTELSNMLDSVERITASKLSKYLPVILVEHVQNLKPDGIWVTDFELTAGKRPGFEDDGEAIDPEDEEGFAAGDPDGPIAPGQRLIKIKGRALSHVVLGEFITLLKATQNQEVDPSDLRTRVYFNQVNLNIADLVKGKRANVEVSEVDSIQFDLVLSFDERDEGAEINEDISKILKKFRDRIQTRL